MKALTCFEDEESEVTVSKTTTTNRSFTSFLYHVGCVRSDVFVGVCLC